MESTQEQRLRDLAISGGISGLLMGAGAAAIGPFRKWSQLARAAGIGTAGGAGVAAGSGYVGDEFLGDPELQESNPYTKRTGLGGLAVGGAAGGLAGAALGTGIGQGIAKASLPDNLLTKRMFDYIGKGSLGKAGKLGAVGSLLGAGTAGFLAADEGMQMDMIENERRRKFLEEVGYGNR